MIVSNSFNLCRDGSLELNRDTITYNTCTCGGYNHGYHWDNYESPSNRPYGRDYWHSRNAFLKSYHFSDQDSIKDNKLKRSLKGLNKAAMGVVLDIRRDISRRRPGIRVFRFTLGLPSSFAVFSIRCFAPWFNKNKR
ncbi:uncharacterized protein LOC119980646 [Tripterygium wilfordii]|nr:uncharacterized protein LOC119980646 [Tripterygium wilfordii]